jgi:CBS-domain-containing membrane protein
MSRWKVTDVMSVDVASVPESARFREIVELIEDRKVSGVPVVDGIGRVVGVVSEADLLAKIEYSGSGEGHTLFESRRRRAAIDKAAGVTAYEVMTKPPVTVLPSTSVVLAARLMDSSGVKRLPVVDEFGRLVGIVTGQDLVKVFLRADEAIAADVRTDLGRVFGARSSVSVRVVEGVVTLAGELDRKSLVPVMVGLTERVDGVVEVVNNLTYRYDDEPLVVNIP